MCSYDWRHTRKRLSSPWNLSKQVLVNSKRPRNHPELTCQKQADVLRRNEVFRTGSRQRQPSEVSYSGSHGCWKEYQRTEQLELAATESVDPLRGMESLVKLNAYQVTSYNHKLQTCFPWSIITPANSQSVVQLVHAWKQHNLIRPVHSIIVQPQAP